MALSFLSDYARVRNYTPDNVTVTVTQKLLAGDNSDAVTDAKRLSRRDLFRNFAPASIDNASIGYVIWEASLSNVTSIKPDDEITDGSDVFIVRDVAEGHFENSRQFICRCTPKKG